MSQNIVVCETSVAIVTHLRHIGSTPGSYSGFAQRPLTFCGKPAAWDTRSKPELENVSCKVCAALLTDSRKSSGSSEVY